MRVDHQQRRVAGGVDRLRTAAMSEVTPVEVSLCTTHTALMRVLGVGAQALLDQVGLHAAAPAVGRPVAASVPGTPGTRAAGPGARPSSATARRSGRSRTSAPRRPGSACWPAPLPRRRCPRPGRSTTGWRVWKTCCMPVEHLQAERAELGAAVVDGGQAHRPQDAVGHRARAGDLQEVAAAGMVVECDSIGHAPGCRLHVLHTKFMLSSMTDLHL